MDLKRQQGIVSEAELKRAKVAIIGSGSIGSYTAFALAKMGVKNIAVIDFDKVEKHNIPNQLFRESDLGIPKVSAIKEIIRVFTGTKIDAIEARFDKDDPAMIKFLSCYNIIISAVDSMAVRKQIFEATEKMETTRFIDTRMGRLAINIYNINAIDERDRKEYLKTWFPDEKASPIPCTQRGIIYPVMSCASIVCDMIKKHVKREQAVKHHLYDFASGIHLAEHNVR